MKSFWGVLRLEESKAPAVGVTQKRYLISNFKISIFVLLSIENCLIFFSSTQVLLTVVLFCVKKQIWQLVYFVYKQYKGDSAFIF